MYETNYATGEDAIFALVYLIVYFIALLFSAYFYVGMSLGTFRMMRKVGLENAWMAWVPVCNYYALGKLADHQTAMNEGKSTGYRKKLLAWTIVNIGLFFLFLFSCVYVTVVAMLNGLVDEYGNMVELTDSDLAIIAGPSLFCLLTIMLCMAFAIVFIVCYFISLHKIYTLFAPNGAVGLTVLSIFVLVAVPAIFLVLASREPSYEITANSDVPPSDPADMGQNYYSL